MGLPSGDHAAARPAVPVLPVNKRAVQRLEWLGDTVLKYVVRQLRDRHPDKKEGELDCLRTALVNSLHQARPDAPFGRETTRRFFDDIGKAEQRAAISKFIDEVPSRDEVPHLDALWALEKRREHEAKEEPEESSVLPQRGDHPQADG